MKTTIPKLRRMIRKVIHEHVGDDHDRKLRNGKVPAVSEPHDGYVKDSAEDYIEKDGQREDYEAYLKFGEHYGYDEEQLEQWFDAAHYREYNSWLESELENTYSGAPHEQPKKSRNTFGLHADDYPIGMGRPLKESMSPQHPYYDMVAEVIMRVSRDVMFGHISGRDAIYNECVIQADENEVGTHIDYIFEKVMARVQAMGL